MAETVYWFNHADSTIRYELSYERTADSVSYRARVWKDGVYIGDLGEMVEREHVPAERWTDSTVELLAVSRAERTIRSMLARGLPFRR